MGPPFITAEWAHLESAVHSVLPASMGPPFITAEWRHWVRVDE
jgi:hypothetical protein